MERVGGGRDEERGREGLGRVEGGGRKGGSGLTWWCCESYQRS